MTKPADSQAVILWAKFSNYSFKYLEQVLEKTIVKSKYSKDHFQLDNACSLKCPGQSRGLKIPSPLWSIRSPLWGPHVTWPICSSTFPKSIYPSKVWFDTSG